MSSGDTDASGTTSLFSVVEICIPRFPSAASQTHPDLYVDGGILAYIGKQP